METTNYELNEAKMFADITDGTAIIINSVTGIYYGMNSLGTAVFENLVAGSSAKDIANAFKTLENAPEDSQERIDKFISNLLSFEIIIPRQEISSKEAVIDEAIAKTDNYTPECTEYKDVQELLFADPIHDVEEEKGWTPE